MAAPTAALKAAYQTEINKLSDALGKARANFALDRLIDALTSQSALESNEIQGYTIAGRTVSRRNSTEGLDLIDRLTADLDGMIYGSVTLVDMNKEVAEPGGTPYS